MNKLTTDYAVDGRPYRIVNGRTFGTRETIEQNDGNDKPEIITDWISPKRQEPGVADSESLALVLRVQQPERKQYPGGDPYNKPTATTVPRPEVQVYGNIVQERAPEGTRDENFLRQKLSIPKPMVVASKSGTSKSCTIS